MERRFKKTELDSKRSLYDGMIDRAEDAAGAESTSRPSWPQTERELVDLSKELEEAQAEFEAKKHEKEKLLGNVERARQGERSGCTREADRVKRLIEQKDALYGGPLHWYSQPMAFLRSLPGIDLAPPTKIQQISLPELLINYNFKEVPRYDRCQTCHQGIDRARLREGRRGQGHAHGLQVASLLHDGATTSTLAATSVKAGLYLDANGPHPINSFGCTICHGGQGSGTDFTFASHTPDSLEQAEDWTKKHGWQRFPLLGFPDASRSLHRVGAA